MDLDSASFNFDCRSCGTEHRVDVKKVVIAPGAAAGIEDLAASLGLTPSEGIAVYDTNTFDACEMHPQMKKEVILNAKNLHANEQGIAHLREKTSSCSFMVAVGAGTVHDLTRYTAFKMGIPFLSVPTACSVDGFASHSCSMTLNGLKTTVFTRMPMAICADVDILRKAPLRLSLSGLGDMVGKYTALCDWQLASLLGDGAEAYCPSIGRMQKQAVSDVMQTADKLPEKDADAYAKLIYGLLLSGMAMQMAGSSRPAAGAEHYISHFWEMEVLGIPTTGLHGERVGIGTLMALRVYREILEAGPSYFSQYRGNLLSEEEQQEIFGKLYGKIRMENAQDTTASLTREILLEKWPQIVEILGQLPEIHALESFYQAMGMRSSMEEIGLPSSEYEHTLRWSPYVRNKITLLRIAGRR